MIKDKLPSDLIYVPPMDVIIESIEALEKMISSNTAMLSDLLRQTAGYVAKVDKIQKDFNLIKKYTE